MFKIKYKYNKEIIQLWSLKVALFFSVFAFSGFNTQIRNTFLESTKTELVESRDSQPIFSLKHFTHQVSIAAFKWDYKNDIWALSIFNQSTEVKYQSLQKLRLSYTFSSVNLPIKMPVLPTEDSVILSSLG